MCAQYGYGTSSYGSSYGKALTTTHTVAPMATNMDLLNMATRPCTTTNGYTALIKLQLRLWVGKVDETLELKW